jgi:integrase
MRLNKHPAVDAATHEKGNPMATASAQRARHGSYVFQRPGSVNWYVQLRTPQADGKTKRKEVSLGTPDKLTAEILATPMIAEHKAALLAARPRLVASWHHAYEPGQMHTAPDGVGQILATDRELHFIGHNGAVIRTEPNGYAANRLENWPMGAIIAGDATPPAKLTELRRQGWGPVINLDRLERPSCPTKTGDDAFLETYLKHADVTGDKEREARDMWALFKSLTKGKALKDCDRDDGRLLVERFDAQGLKSATMRKKIGWLSAAVNLAIKEGKLKFNPFAGIVPNRDDAERRKPLSDADIATCKDKLDKLSDADRLLLRVLATTGMREGEAYQIDGEQIEEGTRFVIVGTKTDASLRRVPLPADLLPHLPATISGPLFAADTADRFAEATIKRLANRASKRLMSFLRDDCSIADPNKVVHSLRHRAQDRLRRAACPKPIRQELLGHDEATVGESYGEGHPVPMLKEWIDRISF